MWMEINKPHSCFRSMLKAWSISFRRRK